MIPDLLTVAEVAEILRLSKSTIYNLVWAGEIPAIRVGRRKIRIRKDWVSAHIDGGDSRNVTEQTDTNAH